MYIIICSGRQSPNREQVPEMKESKQIRAKPELRSRSSSSEAYPVEPLDSSQDFSVTQTVDRLAISDKLSLGTESRTFDIATVLALYEKKRRHRRKFQAKLAKQS